MCGRFSSTLSAEFIRRLFGTQGDLPNLDPSWNLAPSQDALVVHRYPETGARRLDAQCWGLVPHFTKDVNSAAKPINAWAESVATSGMFRGAFTARRCIVPAGLFYEWKKVVGGNQPYAITRQDKGPLAFGGIWEGRRLLGGEVLRTFAIITTAANREMADLHDRLPNGAGGAGLAAMGGRSPVAATPGAGRHTGGVARLHPRQQPPEQ